MIVFMALKRTSRCFTTFEAEIKKLEKVEGLRVVNTGEEIATLDIPDNLEALQKQFPECIFEEPIGFYTC